MMSHELPLSIMILDQLLLAILTVITDISTLFWIPFIFSLSQNPGMDLSPFDFPSSSFISNSSACLSVVFLSGSFSRDNHMVIEETKGGGKVKQVEVSVVVLQ